MAHEWKRHVVTDDGAERAVQNIITHLNVLLTDEQKAEINWHPDQSVSLAIMRVLDLLNSGDIPAEQQPGQGDNGWSLPLITLELQAELARWQVCGNCGEKLEGPGHCGSCPAVTEHEKVLERMLDETLTRAEKAEDALAFLRLDYDILRGRKKHDDVS